MKSSSALEVAYCPELIKKVERQEGRREEG